MATLDCIENIVFLVKLATNVLGNHLIIDRDALDRGVLEQNHNGDGTVF